MSKFIMIALIILALFIPAYGVLLIILAITLLELKAIRKAFHIKISPARTTYVYLLPIACTLNPLIPQENLFIQYVTIVSAFVLLALTIARRSIYSAIYTKDIQVSIKDGTDNRRDALGFLHSAKIPYILFLVAVAVDMYVPGVGGSVYIFVATALLVNIVFMLKNHKEVRREEDRAVELIREYRPKFAVYFALGKPAYSVYTMWDEYFKRTKEHFIIVTPQERHFHPLSKLTDVPVVFCKGGRDVEKIIGIDSIRAVFYPTNSGKNLEAMIPTHPFHIHIGHGDSDKATSYRSVTAMYDRIFVAGEEAIMRYENHGVAIPRDKFMIVGRPQVERIELARDEVKSVVYAPTWHGDVEALDYSSLYLGKEIVQALIDRDLRVIFRPHPNSRRSPKLTRVINEVYDILAQDNAKRDAGHLFGIEAEGNMDVVDCANLSDVMISDVSSVTSDYLYSEKPIILISMKETLKNFVKNNPIARAAYIVDNKLTGLGNTLDNLIEGKDLLREKRKSLKEGYLSSPERNKGYADLFVDAVKQVITMDNPRHGK